MSVPPPLAAGVEVAPGYRVVTHLNRARTLDVYDVWSEERECRCIAKTLRPDRLEDASAHRRLEREGRLLRRLSHPHVVRGYELVSSSAPVVVLEMLSGQTLAHLIELDDELSPSELAYLGIQLGSAVQYLHGNRILHLDLKPSNVVAECGRAKLIDLSVARRPGRVPAGGGTWCYMAPEQVRGGEVGPAADVWGIGVVLWEAAVRRAAFGGDEDGIPASGDLAGLPADDHPQLRRPADPVSRHRRLPPPLARAIDAALAADPARRPSVAELSTLLVDVPGVLSPRSPRPE